MHPPIPHQRRSVRLPGYDYTQPGAYFITIVAYEWKHCFGAIANGQITLNELGQIAESEWKRLPLRFPGIELDSFTLMPNHLHGIIVMVGEARARGLTNHPDQEDSPRAPTSEDFCAPVSRSIPTIVRSYKASVSWRFRLLHGTNSNPLWQRNYYEHIIRSEGEWAKIRDYIETNPLNWKNEEENR